MGAADTWGMKKGSQARFCVTQTCPIGRIIQYVRMPLCVAQKHTARAELTWAVPLHLAPPPAAAAAPTRPAAARSLACQARVVAAHRVTAAHGEKRCNGTVQEEPMVGGGGEITTTKKAEALCMDTEYETTAHCAQRSNLHSDHPCAVKSPAPPKQLFHNMWAPPL